MNNTALNADYEAVRSTYVSLRTPSNATHATNARNYATNASDAANTV